MVPLENTPFGVFLYEILCFQIRLLKHTVKWYVHSNRRFPHCQALFRYNTPRRRGAEQLHPPPRICESERPQRPVELGGDVVDVLEADGEADELRQDAAPAQILVGELRVRGRGRLDDERLGEVSPTCRATIASRRWPRLRGGHPWGWRRPGRRSAPGTARRRSGRRLRSRRRSRQGRRGRQWS